MNQKEMTDQIIKEHEYDRQLAVIAKYQEDFFSQVRKDATEKFFSTPEDIESARHLKELRRLLTEVHFYDSIDIQKLLNHLVDITSSCVQLHTSLHEDAKTLLSNIGTPGMED